MRRLFILLLLASAYDATAQPVGNVQEDSVVVGTWLGTLSIPAGQLRIVFHVTQATDGTLTATMDSPDQGATGIPTSSVTYQDNSLRIEVGAVQGVYEGTVESADRISGTWQQGGASLPLELQRVADLSEALQSPARPQEPKPPFPYVSEEVSFDSAEEGTRLAGTLTLPSGQGPFPAVVLISGSGPQDRDETIFGHKPFLVLADHLTRQEIAVLRYDDRGVGGSTGDLTQATIDNFAQDTRGALHYLLQRDEIDTHNVGLIGHSEGALVAPLVASDSDSIAFMVLLAPPGVTGQEIILEQSALLMRAGGASEAQIGANREVLERILHVLNQTDTAARTDSVTNILVNAGVPHEAAEAQAQQFTSPWFQHFLTYDPQPALASLDIPVLVLFGAKDLQVPPAQNAAVVEEALNAGENTQATVQVLPGLNHLFQTAETGGVNEYGQIEETFNPEVLELIASWIKELALGD